MSKKNVFLVAMGYVAGGIISSFYNKKKPEELKKDLEKSRKEGEGDFKVILNNFITTHQNLLEDLKVHVMSEKNKELFNTKKEEVLKIVDTYKDQGVELANELKNKGKVFISEASDSLEKLYVDKKDEIEALKESAPDKVKEIKEKAKKTINEVKKNIQK